MDFENAFGIGLVEAICVETGGFLVIGIGQGIWCLAAEEFLPASEKTAMELEEVEGFDFMTVGGGFLDNGIAVLGIGDFGGRTRGGWGEEDGKEDQNEKRRDPDR